MLVVAAVKLTAVPTSAIAHGAPVKGIGTVLFAAMLNFAVVAVPAAVKVMLTVSAAVPLITSCQTRMLCPAEDAIRFADEPVPATATDRVGNDAFGILLAGPSAID